MPVRIASPYLVTFINEGFPLSIGFTAVPTCADTPSEWTVVKKMNELGYPVKLIGYKNTLIGVFTIKRHEERDYKIQFCGYDSMMCGDVGIHVDDDGVRHVVVGHVNGPFLATLWETNPPRAMSFKGMFTRDVASITSTMHPAGPTSVSPLGMTAYVPPFFSGSPSVSSTGSSVPRAAAAERDQSASSNVAVIIFILFVFG
ncbi:kunitz-type trypsin inhibitor KTI1-like [Senna tora]|uniref:Kunitz-type trypsin inhibitor KTI1-like n=1 Tax=Senna tora TaxID=362788 RepID=A0A834WDQ1_9FABA|nr:kunitz-type trypsin inhibitor KTI1-like [Senna tora]